MQLKKTVASYVKRCSPTLIGWLLALVCVVAGVTCIASIAGRELSLVLCVDGTPVCLVENRVVVDEALRVLDERLLANGITDLDLAYELSYRLTDSTTVKKADVDACVELLYSRSVNSYVRGYVIAVEGIEIAACATYAEAEEVVNAFKKHIVEQVQASRGDGKDEQIELTTEFEIRSVFCKRDRIATAADINRVMINAGGTYDPDSADGISDSRVTANGSLSILYADKNLDFGLIKNEIQAPLSENDFSFNMSGLNSAIEYKTVIVETYSEIIGYETIYLESADLYLGETRIEYPGENGLSENVYEVSYIDGVEVSRKLVSSTVVSQPKARVELVGTKEQPSTEPTGAFMWPVNVNFVITSYFGSYRHQFDAPGTYHYGLDIAGMRIGTPIYAADGGTVIFAGSNGSYGIMVKIRHEEGVETYYAHMRRTTVKVGDKVYKGQQIGEIGMTGVTTGPHVHFEVRIGGKPVNPIDYLPTNKS